ncbi:MAG: type II toxin-antitoxin system RelB/DinJ family antitoxin [Coriobacteriales bacterium]|jgi:DNA-damage-inducible protein J|nr:type II toxin-antitoxin system RelB/DinJ family antitoxin [Coriobacteriales bacterium]
MNDTLSIRMDKKLKQEFIEVVESIGLDAPTAVRMFALQTVKTKSIPLSLSAKTLEDDDSLSFMDSIRADWGDW